jgi:REP element-mobilizing transposase RayT
MPDHIHIFSDLHPTICLSDYVKAIKVASSLWMKGTGSFLQFSGWQDACLPVGRGMVLSLIQTGKEI